MLNGNSKHEMIQRGYSVETIDRNVHSTRGEGFALTIDQDIGKATVAGDLPDDLSDVVEMYCTDVDHIE
ncbi:MAG: hypothetical protein ABEN55_00390 [Bradymonadaceae bacterium]